MTAELQRDAVAAMTDAAVLGHGQTLEHCAGGDVHPPPNPAAAPPAIQESRGSAPTRAAEDSLVSRALSTGAPASGGGVIAALRSGARWSAVHEASRSVHMPGGEHRT